MNPPTTDDLSHLWELATEIFALGTHTLHGPDHWQRVERNGVMLAAESGADVLVVRVFAILHDSHRQNESHDPLHGQRAVDWAKVLFREKKLPLNESQLHLLRQACIGHDKGMTSDDPTIGTCWDADRLDLPRVGVRPQARFMSTATGRREAMKNAK